MKMDKAYCLTRADYHRREMEGYLRDAETALQHSVGDFKDVHHDRAMKSAEMHEEQIELWTNMANGKGME